LSCLVFIYIEIKQVNNKKLYKYIACLCKNSCTGTGTTNKILIYEDVFEKLYPGNSVQSIAQTVSHEFWHLFAVRFQFYNKLEKIYTEKIKPINKLNKEVIENFLNFLNGLDDDGVEVIIGNFNRAVPCWTEEYIHEQAWYDSKKKFFNRIDHFELRGLIDEMFAEAYAGKVIGVNSATVHKMFVRVIKSLFGDIKPIL
jgi:hypothetical protein